MICRGYLVWIFAATQFWRLRWARNVARIWSRKSFQDFFVGLLEKATWTVVEIGETIT